MPADSRTACWQSIQPRNAPMPNLKKEPHQPIRSPIQASWSRCNATFLLEAVLVTRVEPSFAPLGISSTMGAGRPQRRTADSHRSAVRGAARLRLAAGPPAGCQSANESLELLPELDGMDTSRRAIDTRR